MTTFLFLYEEEEEEDPKVLEWLIRPLKSEAPGMLGIWGRPLRPVAWIMWFGWRIPNMLVNALVFEEQDIYFVLAFRS